MIYLRAFLAFMITINSFTFIPTTEGKRNEFYNNNIYQMSNFNNSDSSLLAKLKNIDKRKYIGNTVALFLQNRTIANYRHYFFIDEPPGKLGYLNLEFSKKINIEIIVKKYLYVVPYDEKRKWDLSTFRKEIISEIRIMFEDNPVEIINSFSK